MMFQCRLRLVLVYRIVRALPNGNVPKASLEPATEDDWEVVDLNAHLADAAILTQLVPGSEIAVAPKSRIKSADCCNDSGLKPLDGSHSYQKVLLRVQDPLNKLIQESELGGETVGVELTSIALVHPDTAKDYQFESLHGVYVQRYSDFRKNDSPYFLSPCQFKILHKSKDTKNNTTDVLNDGITLEDKPSIVSSTHDMDESHETYLSPREKLVYSLLNGTDDAADEKTGIPSKIKDRLKGVIHAWISAQSQAISLMTGVKPMSLILCPSTLLCFKLMPKVCSPEDNQTTSTTETLGDGRLTVESVSEILYMLTVSGESLHGQKYTAYELTIKGNQSTGAHDDLKLFCENLNLGTYVSYNTCNDHVFNPTCASTLRSLSWMGTAVSDVINRLTSLLSSNYGALPVPGHVLIYGPPGSGKTSLSAAVSKSLEENKDIQAHTVFIGCSAFSLEKASIRQILRDYVSEALDNAPSIIVFDDLDSIATAGGDTEGSQMSASVVALTKFIAENLRS